MFDNTLQNLRNFGLKGILFSLIRSINLRYRTSLTVNLPFTIGDRTLGIKVRPHTTDEFTYREVVIAEDLRLPEEASIDVRVIVDAGANIGLSALYWALKYPKATVYAIEPEPANFSLLLKNTGGFCNIVPIHAALWNADDVLLYIVDRKGDGSRAFEVLNVPPVDGYVTTVPCISMDHLMKKYGVQRVDILKMDIEGSEREVLSSSASWIDRVNLLLIELHENMRSGCDEAFESVAAQFERRTRLGEKELCYRCELESQRI